jgi:type III pantothenate kinase
MLLVVDVGNTNIVLGLWQDDELIRTYRLRTVPGRTSDEMGVLFMDLFRNSRVEASPKNAIISCVVPDQLRALQDACSELFGIEPLVVGPGIRTGVPILADNPREVGADRIVNAVAAFERVGGACVVVDFGTATTFDVVSARGEYIGGVIAPGFQISAEALTRRTSKLPNVEVARPRCVIGRNTIHSMQSGLFYGYVSLVDGLVTRVRAELGEDKPVRILATGGLASIIATESQTIDEVVDNLTLEGLRLLYEHNS